MYNKRYRDEYGQMVICADGMNTWRREYFPEYKASRKKSRDNSEMDWNIIFNTCLLYTSPSPRDRQKSRMPSSA